jgi:hypothetical protein
MDQTENNFAPLQILDNKNESIQHTLINNTGITDTNLNTFTINTINTATSTTQNTTFEFYFHLPNDARIFRVTYSELQPSENIRLLNSGINLSHIPDYKLPHHYNVQSFIRQQIQQRVQQPIQQHSFDTTRTHMTSLGNTSDNLQDMGYVGVLNNQNTNL